MTLEFAVIASSVVGAMLFFFGGYYFARPASSPLPETSALEQTPGQAVRDGSATSPHGTKLVADDVSDSLEIDALRDEIVTCRNRLAKAEQEQGRIAALEEEAQQHREKYRKLEDENRELQERWNDKEREAGNLRDEKSDLKRRLQQTLDEMDLLKEQAGRLKELEAERDQLTIRLESLERQVAVLEPYKEESARLTTLVAEVPHLRNTVDHLKQENRELRSQGLAYQPPTATTPKSPTPHLGSSMQHLLERFTENKGARGAALADEHGLLVAGTSEYAEGLAVTSALCDGLMTQLANILPLATLRQLVIVDTNAVAAAIYPFQVGPDRLILASLSVGPRPNNKAIDDFISQASLLIDGKRS